MPHAKQPLPTPRDVARAFDVVDTVFCSLLEGRLTPSMPDSAFESVAEAIEPDVNAALRTLSLFAEMRELNSDPLTTLQAEWRRLWREEITARNAILNFPRYFAAVDLCRAARLMNRLVQQAVILAAREGRQLNNKEGKGLVEAETAAKQYLARHRYSGLRAMAKAIGCSKDTLRKCPSVRPFVQPKVQAPKAVATVGKAVSTEGKRSPSHAVEPIDPRGQEALEDLDFQQSLELMMKELPPDQRARFLEMPVKSQRELVESWEAQRRDAAEADRRLYTRRRAKV